MQTSQAGGHDGPAMSTQAREDPALPARRSGETAGRARIAWAVATLVVVQAIVCGIAVLPVLALWAPLFAWAAVDPAARVVAASFAVIPSYVLFALVLMFASATATRVTGWRDAAGRRDAVGRPGLAGARLGALHGRDPHRAPVRGHALPGDARLERLPAPERGPGGATGVREQPGGERPQPAGVRRRRGDRRRRAPLRAHRRGRLREDGPGAPGRPRHRRAGFGGGHRG